MMCAQHPSQSSHEYLLHLLHKAVFLFDRQADRLLIEKLDTTFSQYLILLAVARYPGLSQRHIAAFLNLTPAAISRMVNTLVKDKLLTRVEDPANRRMHTVRLTKKGEERFADMHTLLHTEVNHILDNVSDQDISATTQTLRTLLISLDPECAYCDSVCSKSELPSSPLKH